MVTDNLITSAETAEILGCSVQYVRQLARRGDLLAQKIGGTWLFEVESVNSYRRGGASDLDIPDHATRRRPTAQRIGLSFFSGALGLDLGLEASGIEFALACEIDPASRRTIEANRPGLALIGDIREHTAADIRAAAGLTNQDEIFLVAGGPPCQAFSSAGRRQGFADDRGNVFLDFVERAIDLQPRFVVIENVRGLLSMAMRPASRDTAPESLAQVPGSALF